MLRTFRDMISFIWPVLVVWHVFAELYARVEICFEYIHLVQEQDQVHRGEQLIAAYHFPQFE